ncbi:MAG: hypothetical protein RL632_2379 [Bacteroidota bacterium]
MKKLFLLTGIILILAACGKNENRPIEEYVSAFLNENEKVVAFGKADIKSILDDMDYSSIPKFGVIMKSQVKEFENLINLNSSIYYALEGPFLADGTPTTTLAFIEVKNADSLAARLGIQGFDIEEDGDLSYFESGDVAMGMQGNLAIFISKKGEFDGKVALNDAFDRVYGDVSEGKVNQILAAKGDIVMGVSMKNLYATSNTDLEKLNADEKEGIMEMVEGSFLQTSVSFEQGAAVIKMKNYFSPELKKQMFFKKDASASIVSKLGTGNPVFGIALNLDLKKMQAFIDKYAASAMRDVMESLGPLQMVMASSKDGLAGILTGELGLVMVGQPNANEGISDMNMFVGLKPAGKPLADMAKGFLELSMAKVDINSRGLSAYSNAEYVPVSGQKIRIPRGCENFGKKGITGFVNLEEVDMESFGLTEEEKILTVIKYVTFEMDDNGATIRIQARDGKENILKQAAELMVKEFEMKISGLTL